MVTELVPGETLVTLGQSGIWTKVVVPAHQSGLDERGYPGWVSPDAPLAPAGGWSPDLVVSRSNGPGLPLGSLLRATNRATNRTANRATSEAAALPDEKEVILSPGDALALGAASPASATGIALSLLGLPYRWGGTDSTTGMDCSGLVYRVMQLLGVTVPRDSHDQFERAPFRRTRSDAGWHEARTGDLVFFGEQGITHVGLYLGGGGYVSAHGADDTCRVTVRSMTDDNYQGFARYERA